MQKRDNPVKPEKIMQDKPKALGFKNRIRYSRKQTFQSLGYRYTGKPVYRYTSTVRTDISDTKVTSLIWPLSRD